nr:hypothetical protein GCM10020092_017380 [Actinoplanes digitatis]
MRPAAVGSTAASAGRRTPDQRPSASAAELTVAPVLPSGDDRVGVALRDGEHGRPHAGLDPVDVRFRGARPAQPGGGGEDTHPGPVGRVEGVENRVGSLDRADEKQLKGRIGLAGTQSAVNHDGGSLVPAEEVDGDPRGARLRCSVGRDVSAGLLRSLGTGRSPSLRYEPPEDRAYH